MWEVVVKSCGFSSAWSWVLNQTMLLLWFTARMLLIIATVVAAEASVSIKGMEKKEEVGKHSQEQRSCPHRRMCRKHCVIM